MGRLTTNTPKGNVETALNLFYIKDHETWVRGGGPGPEFRDVSLFDFTRNLINAHIPDADVPENDNDFSTMMAEWLFDDVDTAEGTIATLYAAAWAYAELRHKLAAYEDAEECGRLVVLPERHRVFSGRHGCGMFYSDLTGDEVAGILNAYANGKLVPAGVLAADVAHIVQCKDCKHSAEESYSGAFLCRRKMVGLVRPTDFCSFGERKDGVDE